MGDTTRDGQLFVDESHHEMPAHSATRGDLIPEPQIDRQQRRARHFCDQAFTGLIAQYLDLDAMPTAIVENLQIEQHTSRQIQGIHLYQSFLSADGSRQTGCIVVIGMATSS